MPDLHENPTDQPVTDQDRPAEPVSTLDTVGMGLLGLIGLGGLWLVLAPFLVGYQGRGADWTSGTVNDVVLGIALAILALVGLIAVIGGSLRAIIRRGPLRFEAEAEQSA